MRHRHLLRVLFVLAAASAVYAFPAVSPPTVLLGDSVTRYYSMTAHVRPFLIWMTRDDVGGARISWTAPQGKDESLELLIGSDPDRAPMGINRWGFIAERTVGETTELTGLMTETDDRSIDAARTNGGAIGASHAFRSIRGTVRNGEAKTVVSRLSAPADLTYGQYQVLLDRLPSIGTADAKRITVGPGTEPGFLIAVRRSVHDAVEDCRASGHVKIPTRRRFVYAGNQYELTLTAGTVVKDAVVGGRRYGQAIEGQFEIRNLATGTTTPFTMLFGADPTDAETPLRIVYRPRWWVELELVIVDPRSSGKAFAYRIGSPQ